jgi:menaquinone-dependent protoporphyrinogen oxidase
MQPKMNLDRRTFLKLAGIATVATLAACSQQKSSEQTENDMKTMKLDSQNGKKYLVAYASKYGSTAGIAEAIGQAIHETGAGVDVIPVQQVSDLSGYDGALIGSAIYMGQWRKEALGMIEKHQSALQAMPVAYFAGCLTMASGTEEEKATALTYCDAPAAIVSPAADPGVFAGELDTSKLNILEKLIMKAMKPPVGDHRDWSTIQSWARNTAAQL